MGVLKVFYEKIGALFEKLQRHLTEVKCICFVTSDKWRWRSHINALKG